MRTGLFAIAAMLIALRVVGVQPPGGNVVPVNVDNFVRAESDMYLHNMVKEGSLGKFAHRREPASIDNRAVIRANRDTLYSAAVFDLDAGPVTITLPEAGRRLMSMEVISQDHYVPLVVYGAGSNTFDKAKIETRYCAAIVRTVVDPMDAKDLKQGQSLQDSIRVEQQDPGKFEVPNWDQISQKQVRDALLVLGSSIPDFKQAFGTKEQVDPLRHLIGTALNWGENPNKDAIYRSVTPGGNDGSGVSRLVVKEVPVDAFWSITIGNAKGYLESNERQSFSINSLTAKKDSDGAIAVQFGGCDQSSPSGSGAAGGKVINCLSIAPGWNYIIRLYRPRQEILDGKWSFPLAQPVGSR